MYSHLLLPAVPSQECLDSDVHFRCFTAFSGNDFYFKTDTFTMYENMKLATKKDIFHSQLWSLLDIKYRVKFSVAYGSNVLVKH